jgi:hypothetical protein
MSGPYRESPDNIEYRTKWDGIIDAIKAQKMPAIKTFITLVVICLIYFIPYFTAYFTAYIFPLGVPTWEESHVAHAGLMAFWGVGILLFFTIITTVIVHFIYGIYNIVSQVIE